MRFLHRRHVLVIACVAAILAGCSSGKGIGGWFGQKSSGATQVAYAGADRVPVLDAPAASAKTIGALSLHQKVTRSKVENGYARIRTANGKLEGWVLSSKLLWKLPGASISQEKSAPGSAAAQATGSGESVPPESVTEPEPVTEPETAPAADAASPAEAAQQPEPEPAATTNAPAAPAAKQPKKPSGARTGASVFDAY